MRGIALILILGLNEIALAIKGQTIAQQDDFAKIVGGLIALAAIGCILFGI